MAGRRSRVADRRVTVLRAEAALPLLSDAGTAAFVLSGTLPVTPATLDDFNSGANQALSARAGWGAGHWIGTLDLKTDATPTKATTSLGTPASNMWATDFGKDHESMLTFGATIVTTLLVARADAAVSPSQGYVGYITGFGSVEIETRGGATLAAGLFSAPAAGDSYRLRCVGDLITLDYKPAAGAWTNLLSVTDTLYTTGGFIGLYVGSGSCDIDSFGGGSVVYASDTIVDSGTCYVGVECGDSTPVLDDFNKGPGQNVSSRIGFGSGAYWGEPTHVVNGTPDAITTPVGSGWFANYWNDIFTDQEVWGTYGSVGTNQFWIASTRSSIGNNPSDYELSVTADTGDWSLDWYVSGALQPNLGAGTFPTHAAGDSFKLRSVGSKHTVLFKPAGGEWTVQGAFTEATLTSGRITLQGRANVTAGSLTDFGGGGLATPAVESVTGGGPSDSGTATIVLALSAAETISDSGTANVVITPSAAETISDAGAVAGIIAPTDAETIRDAGTVSMSLAPSVTETIGDVGTVALTIAPSGAETISDAGTQACVLTPSAVQTIIEPAATVTLIFAPSAQESVTELAALTMVLLPITAQEAVISGTLSDSGTQPFTLAQTDAETISDAGTATLVVAQTAVQTINESGSVAYTLAETAAETITDSGSQSVVLTPTGAQSAVDSGTCALSVTPTSVETLSEAASVVLVLAPSYAFVWPDSGTVSLVLLPSASSEQVQDASTVIFVLTEADSDRESDQGTVSISLTLSDATALVDAGVASFAIARGDLFGPDDLVNPDDVAGPDYVHGFEAIIDASTATIVLVQTASQTISEGGSTFVTITPSQQGIEQGNLTIVLSSTATALISDAGTATVGMTPSAAETLIEDASEFFALGRGDLFGPGDLVYPGDIAGPGYVHGFEAIIDSATCVAVLVPSATETRADATTAAIVLAETALERTSDAGSVTLVLAPTAAEQVRDSGSQTIVLSQTGFNVSGESGTCTLTMVVSAAEQVGDAGTATLVFPETAGATEQDAGTATAVFVSSGAEAIVQSATVTFVLSESETDLITTYEVGTCTIVITPSASETLVDAGTQTATLTPSAAGQAAELATASFALAQSGAETLEDAGTQPVVLSQAGTELVFIGQAGTATFTVTPTAAETVRDATSQSLTIVPSGAESAVAASTTSIMLSRSANYLNVPSASGASTPNQAGLAAGTGVLDLRWFGSLADWTTGGFQALITQDPNGAGIRFWWGMTAAGSMEYDFANNVGGFPVAVSDLVPFVDGQVYGLRVVHDIAAGTVDFYTSTDFGTWTHLGAQATGLATAGMATNGTAPVVRVGTDVYSEHAVGTISKAMVLVNNVPILNMDWATATPGAGPWVASTGETWTAIGTATTIAGPSTAKETLTDGSTCSFTLLSATTTTQPLEAGTCSFSVDGTGAETLVAVPATVTFVVTPTYFGGAPGAAGNLTLALSQTAVETIIGDPTSGTCTIVFTPSHTWTAGFDVNPSKPPLAGGDAAVRRREHDRAARVKALRAGDPQHRDRRLVRR